MPFGFLRAEEVRRSGVDKLPLVNAPEPTGTSTPPNGHHSATNSISSRTTQVSRPPIPPANNFTKKSSLKRTASNQRSDGPHVTKVNITDTGGVTPAGGSDQAGGTVPVSYEKNKTVRIAVNDHRISYDFPKQDIYATPVKKAHRKSRTSQDGDVTKSDSLKKDGGSAKVSRVESVLVSRNDANGWVRAPSPGTPPPPSSGGFTPKKSAEEVAKKKDVTVRPIIIDSWRGLGSSHGGSLMDEVASSDDCQHSTSTLVNTSNKFKGDSGPTQRGFVSVVCGASIIIGTAAMLRLPSLIITYGAGTFLSCFFICLLLLVCPLLYIVAGLAQFNSTGVIGMWSLVPLARGVGWSTVVVCVYWGAASMGLAAPFLHYIVQLFWPESIQISKVCEMQQNSSSFDAIEYYRYCVYHLEDNFDSGVDLRFTWCLPAGLACVIVLSVLSLTCGPVLFSIVVGLGSLLALMGYGVQLYICLDRLIRVYEYTSFDQWLVFLRIFVPDYRGFLNPQIWIGALSQVLLTMGPGIGFMINHSAHNAFRHSLRRHLWFLTILTIFITIFVSFTTVMQTLLMGQREFSIIGDLDRTNYTFPAYEDINSSLVMSDVDKIIPLNHSERSGLGSEHSPPHNHFDGTPCVHKVPGISSGFPFISASHILSTFKTEPWWLHRIFYVLTFLGFFGACLTTVCNCLFVCLVSSREARTIHRFLASFLLMLLLGIVCVPLVTQSGVAILDIFNRQVLTLGILWPPFFLLVALGVCHGFCKVRKDLTFMTESLLSWAWVPMWSSIPVVYMALIVWCIYDDWEFWVLADNQPLWCIIAVWALRIGILVPIPITAAIVVNSQLAYGVCDKIKSSLTSSREWGEWGPKDPIEHHNWRQWREDETKSYASLERRLAKSKPLSYTHSTLSSTGSSTINRLRTKYKENGLASDLWISPKHSLYDESFA